MEGPSLPYKRAHTETIDPHEPGFVEKYLACWLALGGVLKWANHSFLDPFDTDLSSPRVRAHSSGLEGTSCVSDILFLQGFLNGLAHSLFASSRVQPVTYTQVYPLERLADGLRALERRETWGKAIIRVTEEKADEKAKL